MANLNDLLAQRTALDKQIEDMRQREKSSAVEKARALIAQYGLSQEDVFPAGRTRSSGPSRPTGGKVAAKYQDPASGKTWTGRGKPPTWIAGKDRTGFLIK